MLKMRRFLTLLIPGFSAVIAAITLGACAQSPAPSTLSAEPFVLSIAHINDTHSAFDPVPGHFYMATDDSAQRVYNEWGGHPRLHTRIETYRQSAAADTTPFLVLHGGDAWQGSAYFKLNEGRMNADILSWLGIDAMALGNHEFDLTNAHLNAFIDTVNFPLVAANIDASADPDLGAQDNLKPYTLFAFDGDNKQTVTLDSLPSGLPVVAVFGIALDDMPSISPNTGQVQFFDMVTSAQATVDTLQAAGVKKIIALTHIGNAVDRHVAASVNGIDAIVGGHSHTLLGDFSHLGLASNGPYAEQITNPDGGITCVVQAGEYAQAVGLLQLEFDTQGRIRQCQGGNTLLSNDEFYQDTVRQNSVAPEIHQHIEQFIDQKSGIEIVAEHPAMRAHIDARYRPAMEAAYGDVIAQVETALPHMRRPGDNNSDVHGSRVAALIAEAQLAYAASTEVVNQTGLKPDFALTGAGGIRTGIEQGELREGDISLELLPFASSLSIVPLRGSVVRQLLHKVITDTLPQGSHAGRYPYGGHLRYTFEETVAGQQGELTQLDVNTGTLAAPRWRPLQDNTLYTVVINSYLANGNDGWTPLFEAQQQQTDRVDIVLNNGRIQAHPVTRLQRAGDRVEVVYTDQIPDCMADTTHCNTDAVAVINFIRSQSDPLQAIPYPQVTLLRQPANH